MRARLTVPFFTAMALFALVLVPMALLPTTAHAQQRGGRGGAPAAQGQRGAGPPGAQQGGGGFGRGNTPTFPGPPAGMSALPTDLFTSKNFYKDKALWSDKRYWRCNTPRQITDIWTSKRIGDKPPTSASWSDCNADYPREKIVSP